MMDEVEADCDAVAVRFALTPLDRAADPAYCHDRLAVTGNPTRRRTSRPENVENMQTFPFAGLHRLFYRYLCNGSLFCFEFEFFSV